MPRFSLNKEPFLLACVFVMLCPSVPLPLDAAALLLTSCLLPPRTRLPSRTHPEFPLLPSASLGVERE